VEEGLARELVSVLQQARKTQGLEVSDRVRVLFDGEADVVAAIEKHAASISEEVLAVELRRDASAATVETINGRSVRYTLERTAKT